jgi:hypothetical protein
MQPKSRKYRNVQCPTCRYKDERNNGCRANARTIYQILPFHGITDTLCADYRPEELNGKKNSQV